MSNNKNDRLNRLAAKWLKGTLTKAEEDEFNQWYNSFHDHEVQDWSKNAFDQLGIELYRKIQLKNAGNPTNRVHTVGDKRNPYTKIFWAAATLLVYFSISIYLYRGQMEAKRLNETKSLIASVKPGSDQAFLKLDNGIQFDLSQLQEGEIYQTDGLCIQKLESGNLVYRSTNAPTSEISNQTILKNTLRTPAGGQYKVVLSDGTEVWLNAGSEITYPSVFREKERTVQLTGEAYFHVSHDTQKPFIVETAGQKIKVLGTQFNVNAYIDENNIKTTLVEGKVEVFFQGQQYTLAPGEQTIANHSGLQRNKVNIDPYIAWKNGLFVFDKDNLQTVLRQFSRWYNIDVRYETQRVNDRFVGEISRQSKLDDALKILRLGGVAFRMEQNPQTKRLLLIVE